MLNEGAFGCQERIREATPLSGAGATKPSISRSFRSVVAKQAFDVNSTAPQAKTHLLLPDYVIGCTSDMRNKTSAMLSTILLVTCLQVVLGARPTPYPSEEPQTILREDKHFWNENAKEELQLALRRQLNLNQAKNVIFFLGDGMGVSTVTAGRIFAGQEKGLLGEENFLTFEKFPNVGLLKTYNVDKQVADSAGTATAYLTGVKGRYGTIGLDVTAPYNVCRADLDSQARVHSVLKWAQDAGKATGFVTTTRVTHASPAGLYAHVANRDWECDSQIPIENRGQCKDIARQLIEDEPGRNIRIILGGGRQVFEPAMDNGTTKWPCKRGDNLDLIDAWKKDKETRGGSYSYLKNTEDLNDADLLEKDYVLGLFAPSHVAYDLDRKANPAAAPSIDDMTERAIQFLQKKSDKGFFLFVEGGRIDHAHHKNQALLALGEVAAMDRAVKKARELTNEQDTLILVTADHSHTFNINGYPVRGNKITGISGTADNGYNYTTLSYSSGPGFWSNLKNTTDNPSLPWVDPTQLNIHDKSYRQVAQTPGEDAFHGGEDVPVYATGPMAHLFDGVHEQNYVAHVIGHAACMGPYSENCKTFEPYTGNNAISAGQSLLLCLLTTLFVLGNLRLD